MKKMQLLLLVLLPLTAQAETLTDEMINFFKKQTPWELTIYDEFHSGETYYNLGEQFRSNYKSCFLEFEDKYGLRDLKIDRVSFGHRKYMDRPMHISNQDGENSLFINIYRNGSKLYCLETLSRILNQNYGRL